MPTGASGSEWDRRDADVEARSVMARGRERAALVLLCALTSVVALLAVARTFLDGEVADAGVLSLLLICYLAIFAWVLRRLQRSSPRDRVQLLLGAVVIAVLLLLFTGQDAAELVRYQTFAESGDGSFQDGLRKGLDDLKLFDFGSGLHDGVLAYPDEDDDAGVIAYPDRDESVVASWLPNSRQATVSSHHGRGIQAVQVK